MSYLDWKPLVGKTTAGIEVVLRRLHLDDLDAAGRWINSEEIRQVLRVDYPVSFIEEKSWIDRVSGSLGPNPSELPLAICANGQHVGSCGLHEISMRHRHANVGLLIGESEMRGKGIGKVVYALLHRFAFDEMNLEGLCAQVYGHNIPSQRLHDATGYDLAGRIPEWMFKAGEYQDLLIYHLSRKKWKNHQQ